MNDEHLHALFAENEAMLADFWGRRTAAARHTIDFEIFGRRVRLESNTPQPLVAVAHSTPLFSTLAPTGAEHFRIQVVVSGADRSVGSPPDDLMNRNWYSGDGSWLMIHAGEWGHAHVDLRAGRATIVLAPEFAVRPQLFSRTLLNTVLLNFCLAGGFGMLHASCLERDGRLLMLMAPHNTGKSTTALHLLAAGFRLVTDSMIHVVPDLVPDIGNDKTPPTLVAFPVGIGKLRRDMAANFPHLQPLLRPEIVRNETKYVLNLAQLDPQLVVREAVTPAEIMLCLLTRHDEDHSRWQPAATGDVWRAIMANSLFFDRPEIWVRNLAQIERVVARARCYHLTIGSRPAGILQAVEALWQQR